MMAFCFKSFCVLMLFDAVPAALRSVRCACLICVHVSGGGNVSAGEWEAAEKTPFLLVSVTFKVRNGRGGMIYTKVYVGVCVCVSRIVKRHIHTHTEACCVCGGVKMSGWYLSNSTLTEDRGECVGEG